MAARLQQKAHSPNRLEFFLSIDTAEARQPNYIDVHVGSRVRLRRNMIGSSQQDLAKALGVTFQQIQKYERGSNRVSASKLYEIAQTLGVPMTFFFEGLADPVDPTARDAVGEQTDLTMSAFLATGEGLQLAGVFPQIGAPLRRQVLSLVKAMAEAGLVEQGN